VVHEISTTSLQSHRATATTFLFIFFTAAAFREIGNELVPQAARV
jgi:hypothetical protein